MPVRGPNIDDLFMHHTLCKRNENYTKLLYIDYYNQKILEKGARGILIPERYGYTGRSRI